MTSGLRLANQLRTATVMSFRASIPACWVPRNPWRKLDIGVQSHAAFAVLVVPHDGRDCPRGAVIKVSGFRRKAELMAYGS